MPSAADAASARLRMAAESGDVATVRAEIYASGGSAAILDHGGKHSTTALHRACDRQREDVVRVLLQSGADTSRRTASAGQTALHLAAARGNVRILRMLLDAVRAHATPDSTAYFQGCFFRARVCAYRARTCRPPRSAAGTP